MRPGFFRCRLHTRNLNIIVRGKSLPEFKPLIGYELVCQQCATSALKLLIRRRCVPRVGCICGAPTLAKAYKIDWPERAVFAHLPHHKSWPAEDVVLLVVPLTVVRNHQELSIRGYIEAHALVKLRVDGMLRVLKVVPLGKDHNRHAPMPSIGGTSHHHIRWQSVLLQRRGDELSIKFPLPVGEHLRVVEGPALPIG